MAAAFDTFAASVKELPSLPEVVSDLIVTMGREDLCVDEFANKLSNDQALVAKTLRLANSSFYGLPRQVATIQDAVVVLGMRTVRSVVLASSVASCFRPDQCPGFAFDNFWRHSLGTALCAKAIAREVNLSEEAAFTIGLIHDIGRLALVTASGGLYANVLKHRASNDCLLLESEQAVLGTDHCELGGQVAKHWRFAPQIVEAVIGHHEPPEGDVVSLTDIAHVADNIAHALDLNEEVDEIVPPLSISSWSALKLSEKACTGIFKGIEDQLHELCRALLS